MSEAALEFKKKFYFSSGKKFKFPNNSNFSYYVL